MEERIVIDVLTDWQLNIWEDDTEWLLGISQQLVDLWSLRNSIKEKGIKPVFNLFFIEVVLVMLHLFLFLEDECGE